MDIPTILKEDHSKPAVIKIAHYIGEDPERFKILMDCVFSDDTILAQWGAWAMRWTVKEQPSLILPYLGDLIVQMDEGKHVAVKRNVLKILEEMPVIPAEHQETIVDKCFQYLEDRKEPVAVRVFAMSILERTCRDYPELLRELAMLIEEYLPHESAGFQSRGRKILKRLQKK